jgi:hypothetical protein
MTAPGSADRIRIAVAKAAAELAKQAGLAAGRATPEPGDLYVFDAGEEIGLEWLVVRFHPEDPGMVLLAPVDDFPLAGTPDLILPWEAAGRPLTVRCSETDWFPAGLCSSRLRVGSLPEQTLASVRQRLADFARGRTLATEDASSDFDPEYEEWIGEVARARTSLLARAEATRGELARVIPLASLSTTPPGQLASVPALSLAAEAGGPFFTELGSALAESDEPKYYEVPEVVGGRLVLVIGSLGVRATWDGSQKEAPALFYANESGDERQLSWLSGPGKCLQLTEQHVPWIDGRVSLLLGTVPRRTLAIEL